MEVLKLQLPCIGILHHPHLILVEELPHLEHCFEMVSGHLMELSFGCNQLLLVLLLHNFEVELEESLDTRDLLYFKGVQTLKELFKHH